jgi:hypothetical protein
MQNIARQLGLFRFVLIALTLLGCASAADDGSLPSGEEVTASASQDLKGAAAISDDMALDADAADCDAAASAGSTADYEEFVSIEESVSRDSAGSTSSLCRRMCKCCGNGNRFCCSHCRFCSGPIGPYGVSLEALAP